MSVVLSGSLPNDDRNGLAAIEASLAAETGATHVIIALVDCPKVTHKLEGGDVTDVVPTARIRAIEGFRDNTADAAEVQRLWRLAYERRTGKVELPLDVEREFDRLNTEGDNQ